MIPHEHVYDFLLAGRCEVTFYNTTTGNQFKAFISGYPSRKVSKSTLPFTSWTVRNSGYKKLGYIRGDVFIPEGEITEDYRRFKWIWIHIVNQTIPPEMEVMHHGKCSYCARPLTDAESIKIGIGPVCRGKLSGASHSASAKQQVKSETTITELPDFIPTQAEEYDWSELMEIKKQKP